RRGGVSISQTDRDERLMIGRLISTSPFRLKFSLNRFGSIAIPGRCESICEVGPHVRAVSRQVDGALKFTQLGRGVASHTSTLRKAPVRNAEFRARLECLVELRHGIIDAVCVVVPNS